MKILVADDDGPSRYLLKAILEPEGYKVYQAFNGLQAVDILQNEKDIDLIISDIMMPKMDGFQLLRKCKTDPRLKSIPFIIYTANYTKEEDLALTRELGADMVIVKPIDNDEFLNTIKSAIPKIYGKSSAEPVIHSSESEEYLKKYSRRIGSKLDEKLAEIQNLNRLLQAVRRINQMMIRTKSLVNLFENSCNILVKEAGYEGAWIIHFNSDKNVDIARSSGFNEAFSSIVSSIENEKIPSCIQQLYANEGEVLVSRPDEHDPKCPIGRNCGGMKCMMAGLHINGRLNGFIIVFLKDEELVNEDEISLFSEISDDISFAIKNITIDEEKREFETAMIESEKKYRQLFNNASDSIFLHEIINEKNPGKILEANDPASKKLGYTHDELLQMNVSDINTESDNEKAPEIVKELIRKGHFVFEGYHKCKDGSVFPVEISAHFFTMEDRQAILSICRDITERKEMEKQIKTALHQIEENMAQFAILNDEIRNPLTVIVAKAEMAPLNIREPILSQTYEIDRIIKLLDKQWLNSEKIWSFLRRYYGIKREENGDQD